MTGDPILNGTANADRQTDDCEQVLELATPQIYRRNLFRVLGVPVRATPGDVHRLQHRRRMQGRLGVGSPDRSGTLLALDPTPTEEEMRTAMERLHRPIDRFLDELFWFWPDDGNADGDTPLRMLEQAQLNKAAKLWKKQTGHNGQSESALHNLAVLYHVTALDEEARLAVQSLPIKEQKRLDTIWLQAFAFWKQVADSEEFWGLVKSRVRELDDMQLTTGLVRRVRSALPTALLLINAKIAYAAAECSDKLRVQRHVRLLREAGFGDDLVDAAIREAIKPARDRIKVATDNARRHWEAKPQHGHLYVRELREQAGSPLAVVDLILPKDDLRCRSLHDIVAEAMLEGQIAFGNKTNDWAECIKLLESAMALALGDRVRSRLSENLEILQNNAKGGNDWYSPGYWDCSEETVALLEAARAQIEAGNSDGAIRALAAIDPNVGKPLRRCMSFSLNQRGVELTGEALDGLGKPTSTLQQFLDTIDRLGSVAVPHSEMQSWQLPSCPCCGGRGYTSWVNGEYKGRRFWMCRACSEKDDREKEEIRRAIRPRMTEALEYLILADEVDPGVPSICGNIKSVKDIAGDIRCGVPSTTALRQKLEPKKTRGRRLTFQPIAEDSICHFCGQSMPNESCKITVPMCGDVSAVDLLFHRGFEYCYADVDIPRCRRCRDEHRELPGRIEKWHEARLAVADAENFPGESQQVAATAEAARRAEDIVNSWQLKCAAAQNALEDAEAIGNKCERCNSNSSWLSGLCRHCDDNLFRLGALARTCTAAATFAALVAVLILQLEYQVLSPLADFVAANTNWTVDQARRFVPFVAEAVIPMCLCVTILAGLKQSQRRRRQQLRNERQAGFQQRRKKAAEQARKALDQAAAALNAAKQAAQKPLRAYQEALRRFQTVRGEALAAFERVYPKPRLTTGGKPESAYLDFARVKELRGRGWGFGHEVTDEGQIRATGPVSVSGLVAREPQLVKERILVACPACANRQRIPKRSGVIEVTCPCGHLFDVRNGVVHSPAAKANNLKRWKESGEPEKWVAAHHRSWNHGDWLKLLDSLKETPYWPMDEDQIGLVLESVKGRVKDLRAGETNDRSRTAHIPTTKDDPDWSDLILCPHCMKGVPSNLSSCLLCGTELPKRKP